MNILDEHHLTLNERLVMKNLGNFQFMDEGVETEEVWGDTFADDVQNFCGVSNRSVGGIVSSLSKKGFIQTTDHGNWREEAVLINELSREAYRLLNQDQDLDKLKNEFDSEIHQLMLVEAVTCTKNDWLYTDLEEAIESHKQNGGRLEILDK